MPNSAIDPSQVQWDQPAAPPAIDPSQVQWDAPSSSTTPLGAAQAGASGLNAGSADLLGLPVDTARNVLELGKAGAGFLWHETTGKDIPGFLQPNETPDVGSSAWIKQRLRDVEGANAVDVAENTTTNRVLHGAAEAVPSALAGGEATTAPAIARAGAAGAAAGATQQGVAEAGGGTAAQAATGLLAGALTHRATEIAPTPTVEKPVTAQPQTPEPTKFEAAAPTEPGGPPNLRINGQSTAADALRQGAPLPEIPAPSPEGTAAAPVTADVEAARAQTLRDVGLSEARESAITGDTKAAGTDFQTSKLDNPTGNRMSQVIGNEKSALQNYAGQIADATGGSRGLDNSTLYQRGETMAKPVEQLSDYFDQKIGDAYKAADQAAGGVPVEMPTTNDFLKNERSQFLATVEGKQLREGVMARMRDLGLMDEDGNVQPATVQQAERLKQFMSDAWTPRTSRLIGQIKGAIDDDVTQAAGSDIYQAARQTRALRATLLDDPTGIAKLAAPDDRLGINRAVPLEQIPDYVSNLPTDQFGHIVKTLRDVPAEVQPAAASALNEMRAHFASKVEAAGNSTQGMWNVKGANEYLNKNQLKMAEVFSPDEMGRFNTLADAGSILRMDRSYPGAAAQEHNLAMRGALGVVKHGATALGGAIGAHMGAPIEGVAGGRYIGEKLEKTLDNRATTAAVEKRIRKL